MIPRQAFYFIRHGQTDNNVKNILTGPIDIPLNNHGEAQARLAAKLASGLPLSSLCCRPLLRAKQTKDLLLPNHSLPETYIPGLMEATPDVWLEIQRCISKPDHQASDAAKQKFDSIIEGMHLALNKPAPTLIVAHGGIYSSLIYLLQISSAPKTIDNCKIVHFTYTDNWQVNFL